MPRFWSTESFNVGAQAFTIILISGAGLALLVVLGYLAYFMASKWNRRCEEIRSETEEMRHRLQMQKDMDDIILQAFREEFENFKRTHRIPDQPFTGASPSSGLRMEMGLETVRRNAICSDENGNERTSFRTIVHLHGPPKDTMEMEMMEMSKERRKRASELVSEWERNLLAGGTDDITGLEDEEDGAEGQDEQAEKAEPEKAEKAEKAEAEPKKQTEV